MRGRLICVTLITAFMLSACGVKGELDTPPPMWGDKPDPEQAEPTDSTET